MIFVIAIILTVLGTLTTCLNFYLTFIRYPIHRLQHPNEPYKWVSGIPLFGALFLWISAIMFWWRGHEAWAISALILSIFDTSGLHWFLYSMALQTWHKK